MSNDVTNDPSDEKLLSKAMAAENADKFKRLWNGDISEYPSHSEADLTLRDLLAFWTGDERGRIDRFSGFHDRCID